MQYQIKVYSDSGGLGQLQLEAASPKAAEESALSQGYVVLQVVSADGGIMSRHGWLLRRRSFPLLQFSQQLHGLLQAGLTLVDAIETLEEKEPNAEIRAVLGVILERLRQGQSLSGALEEKPDQFPAFYVASLRASEQSGDVAEALRRFIVYQKQVEGLRKQVVSALIYPALLLVIGSLVTLFLLGYVVPKFSRIYESRSESLPIYSRLMMELGTFVSQHLLVLGIGFLGTLLGLVWMLTRPTTRRSLADLAWRMPWLGQRLRIYHLSRLYRTVSMLLHGGTPISAALDMVPGLLHIALREPLALSLRRIREGENVSLAFQGANLTTPVAYRMLRVGERSGQMAEMMGNIAAFYDEEIEQDIGIFTRVFEPVMMALIGILVGGIVIILYMPVFDLAENLQ